MIQGMKPSSAVLDRPNNSDQPVNCCFCSCDFQPTNYEERTLKICQKCSDNVDEYMKTYEEHPQTDNDELNVSYFIM